jgi:magnesium-transporting ATPase (P-type)
MARHQGLRTSFEKNKKPKTPDKYIYFFKCGDIVEVMADETFPCDMVLLYSKTESGLCHIKTANLDGETNLKQRAIPSKMPLFNSEEDLINMRGVISCEKPNARLYEFKGTLLIGDKIYAINNENILLRGTSLQVAPKIYGCAIYAGLDTKMMINSKFKANKMSCVERYE